MVALPTANVRIIVMDWRSAFVKRETRVFRRADERTLCRAQTSSRFDALIDAR
jgi:hypothetical protein